MKKCGLLELELEGNDLGDSGIENLGVLFGHSSRLQLNKLNLSRVGLKSRGVG